MKAFLQAILIPTLFLSSTFAQIWPAAVPLAVRTPYLNSYLDTTAGRPQAHQWPQFWNLGHIVAWDAWIMVDGQPLQLFGDSGTPTNLTQVEITPTRSILTIQAGPMDVTVTFLNPIEPDNLVLQSLPFTYLYIDAESTDGQEHSIQFYSDVTGEWLSADSKRETTWDTVKSASLVYHHASLSTPVSLSEEGEMALDSTIYYAFPNSDGATYRTGSASASRAQWNNDKELANTEDENFRPINQAYPAFCFAVDLGNISSTDKSAMWAFGMLRDPNIKFTSQERHAYFWTKYSNINDAISDLLSDFNDARARAIALDSTLLNAAREISDDYADVVSVAARQAMASVEITVSESSDGGWNTSDIMSFMKDVGGSRRTNPVDVMYAAFPAFLSLNASWAGYLLEPLLRVQKNTETADFAIPDLGSDFPTATANFSPPKEKAIESSGNMLLMVWAHAIFSGDATIIKKYYGLLTKWADFLIAQKTSTSGFTDSDGITNANLALKGILGIKCMAAIANAVGQDDDSSSYSANATALFEEWKSQAVLDNHIVSEYGISSSWGLIYNLYYDRLLELKLVDDELYSQQDAFYTSEFSSDGGDYGIVYDSSIRSNSKSTWSMFAAGASGDTGVRNELISGVHAKINSNASSGVFPTTYSSRDGTTSGGSASPAQGALLSLLALNLERKTPTGGGELNQSSDDESGGTSPTNSNGSNEASQKSNTGAIAGGVVGGVALILSIGIAIFFCIRRSRKQPQKPEKQPYESYIEESYVRPGTTSQLMPMRPTVHSQYRVEPFFPGPQTADPTLSPASPQTHKFTPMRSPWSSISHSRGTPSTNTNSDSEVLRTEVDNLRREMEQMRAQGMYVPPPDYETAAPTAAGSSSASDVPPIPRIPEKPRYF